MQKRRMVLLIPSMLDAHFDLLRFAFDEKHRKTTVLTNTEHITEIGLSYAHNDLCYPGILIIGQLIGAVRSGAVDPTRSVFLIPQAGDACRGSNYLHMIRRALKRAGIEMPVISLNFMEMEAQAQFSVTPAKLLKAIAAVLYGDLLLFLRNQVQPYEKNFGETAALYTRWMKRLGKRLQQCRDVSPMALKHQFQEITASFAQIPRVTRNCVKVGIVGELYIKYCAIGNHNLVSFLLENGAEPMVNGFSWYMLYYIDTHLSEAAAVSPAVKAAYRAAGVWLERLQRQMTEKIQAYGFFCPEPFSRFKHRAEQTVSCTCPVGDGWLIGAEICNLAALGYRRIACVQPFGCMPNHVCGKGLYASIQRRLGNVQLVSLDYDASSSDINLQNRAGMLLWDVPQVSEKFF